MARFKVRIVGGSCGNTLIRITDHLREWITQTLGYDCVVNYQNIWETFGPPPAVDLILQTIPAYTAKDTDAPIISIKPLILDLDHPPTIQKIHAALQERLGTPPRSV